MTDYVKGLDVSVIQGNINWESVAAAGYQFAIMRAGVGNNVPNLDINYTKNIAGAKAAGLKVMGYNFVYPLPPLAGQPLRDPVLQAQMHFKGMNGELAAMDLEWPTNDQWVRWGCSASQIIDWSLTYLQEYEKLTGKPCIIYSFPYFCQSVNFPIEFASRPLWIASYKTTTPFIPKPWTDWALWQFDDGTLTTLPGTNIKVDADRAKDLSLWGVSSTPTPSPDPVPEINTDPLPVPPPAPPVVAPPPPAPVAPPASDPAITASSLVSGAQKVWNLFGGLFKK